MKFTIPLILIVFLLGCYSPYEDPNEQIDNRTDATVTRSTEADKLYTYLEDLGDSYLFGQANARTIGYNNLKNSDTSQSDAKDITGNHPAFIESDFMWYNDNSFEKNDIAAMKLHHSEGGVIGYGWHFKDSSGSFYASGSNTTLVNDIINNNSRKQDWFYSQIDTFLIPVVKELNNADIPLIIRPFHEMNGDWFWWGDKSTTEYINLYKLFVDYIRVEKGYNNILYSWSPNYPFSSSYYPGDSYVDIVGLDYYEPTQNGLITELNKLVTFAKDHGKLSAITETGYRVNGYGDIASNSDFWTNDIMGAINSSSTTKQISYVMSWYNAKWSDSNKNAYIPYSGIENSAVINDFITFKNSTNAIFLEE